MFFDPMYFVFFIPGLLLSLAASWYVKSTFRRWSEVPASRGLSGAEVALAILHKAGVNDVTVEPTDSFMGDHYDPTEKVLRLSPEVYVGRSVAAAGVAAHEVGHALQDAQGYVPMKVRQRLIAPARIGSQLAFFVIAIGLAIQATGLAWFGVLMFSAIVAFELVTLPVELNASARAGERLQATGLVNAADTEGVTAVLRAAALTYLAALVTSLLQLAYFVFRIRSAEEH